MPKEDFTQLPDKIAEAIAQDALDDGLEVKLNQDFSPSSDTFQTLAQLCAKGERNGWLMAGEAGVSAMAAPSSRVKSPEISASMWCA